MAAVWDMIRDERASLVDGLAHLPEQRWTQPSLCGSWTTTDVVGHVLATTDVTPPKFLVGLASSGFSFNNMQEKLLHEATSGKTPNELVGATLTC